MVIELWMKNLDILIEQSLQNKYLNRQIMQSCKPIVEGIYFVINTTGTTMQLYLTIAMNKQVQNYRTIISIY